MTSETKIASKFGRKEWTSVSQMRGCVWFPAFYCQVEQFVIQYTLVMTQHQDFNFDSISIRYLQNIESISIRYRYFVNNK